MRAVSKVELDGITMVFPPSIDGTAPEFRALNGVSLSFARGEVHAILGENGAGKSTLMHVLSGLISPTDGSILADGERARFRSSADALARGIAMVHQRPRLADGLSTIDNALLGESSFFLDRRKAARALDDLAARWNISIDTARAVGEFSPADRLRAALLGALYSDPSFLILDEPTAVLDPDERERFMSAARNSARNEPLGVILVTHKIDDVLTWADRVTVLRKGRIAHSLPVDGIPGGRDQGARWLSSALSPDGDVAISAGDAAISAGAFAISAAGSAIIARGAAFEVRGLTARPYNRNHVIDISFTARPGEITGIVGHPGSGIDTLEDALCGMDKASEGEITLVSPEGARTIQARLLTPAWLRANGVALVPSNRAFRGSHPDIAVRDVLIAGRPDAPTGSRKEANAFANAILEAEGIPVPPDRLAGTLSGGQLQRLILARELGGKDAPRALILAEPEWGLDISSVARLRERLRDAARSGIAVLVLTDTPETMTIANFYSRTISLREGRLA